MSFFNNNINKDLLIHKNSYYEKLEIDKNGNLVASPNTIALILFWFCFVAGCLWLLLLLIITVENIFFEKIRAMDYEAIVLAFGFGILIVLLSFLFRRKYIVTQTEFVSMSGFVKIVTPLEEIRVGLRSNFPEVNQRINVPVFCRGRKIILRLGWVKGGAALMQTLVSDKDTAFTNTKFEQVAVMHRLKKEAVIKVRIAQAAGAWCVTLIVIAFGALAGLVIFQGGELNWHIQPIVFYCIMLLALVFWLQWKSRIAAILLLSQSLLINAWMLFVSEKSFLLSLGFIFTIAYAVGLDGVLKYNRLAELEKKHASINRFSNGDPSI